MKIHIHVDKDRNRRGGGVCIYIREGFEFTPVVLEGLPDKDEIFQYQRRSLLSPVLVTDP